MSDQNTFVPDLHLERYALGELAPESQSRLKARLQNDPALRARLESLHAANAALMESHPPELLARRLQDRLRREQVEAELRAPAKTAPRAQAVWGFGARQALAGTFVLALLAVPAWKILHENVTSGTEVSEMPLHATTESTVPATLASPTAPSANAEGPAMTERLAEGSPTTGGNGVGNESVRLKGLEPKLALFRKTEDGAEPLRPGALARTGDLLRIGYHAGGLPYGAIFSVDGNGNVTRHWPTAGNKAGHLEGGEILLPGAFELDAAPRFERFYLLVSKRAFELEPVRESLLGFKNPTVGSDKDVQIVRFDILKDEGI